MQQRPLSLSIIGWYLIVISVFGFLSTLLVRNNELALQIMRQNPLPIPVQLAIGLLGCVIRVASGYGILKGLNWSRILYAAWAVISLIYSVATLKIQTFAIIGLLFTAVILFFLFRPAANAWFSARGGSGTAAGH